MIEESPISPAVVDTVFLSRNTISLQLFLIVNFTGVAFNLYAGSSFKSLFTPFTFFIVSPDSTPRRNRNIFFEDAPGREYVFPGKPGNLEYCEFPECVNTAYCLQPV